MGVFRKGRHGRIDKDHERHSDIEPVQILAVGAFIIFFGALGNGPGLFRQCGVVLESVRFVFPNPPIVLVDLDVVPSMALGCGHKHQGRLAKGRDVIVVIIDADVLQEFDRPGRVVGLFGPPRASTEIVQDHLVLLVGQHGSFPGVVAALGANDIASVKIKPRCGKSSSTPDIHNGLDAEIGNHVLEETRGNAARIDLPKSTQVLFISGASVSPPLLVDGRAVLHSRGRNVLGLARGNAQRIEFGIPYCTARRCDDGWNRGGHRVIVVGVGHFHDAIILRDGNYYECDQRQHNNSNILFAGVGLSF
mmetsp:Transcript_22963/g.26191  ORF Transcript_22963/g.26191 Transcript_22963/m.26191 type:complete len:306 (+) Transcript_22963:159-1076(+)